MAATIFPLAAAANAALLALALAWRAWDKRAWSGIYAALFLLGAAAAVSLITLDHSGAFANRRAVGFTEGVLTLAAGPLLVLFVRSLLSLLSLVAGLFAPLALYVLAALVAPHWAAHAFVVERLVVVQMVFTAYAAWSAYSFAAPGLRAARARRLALCAVAAMAVLHTAQIVRMTWPQVEAIANIVPLVGGVAFLGMTAAVYFGGRMSALDPLTDAPPVATEAAKQIAAALDAALRGGLLQDANLTLTQAATALGVAADSLAPAVLAVRGVSFIEHVTQLRVAEAQRLLADLNEARTSMEAIGMLAGFGSRSAFYKAFRERTGLSPAAYREQATGNAVQIPKTGQ